MQCPKCGADLPAKAKFCLECGSNISAVSGASDQEQGEVSLGDLRTIAPEGAIGFGGEESIGDLRTLAGPGEKSGTGLADGANFTERYELIEEIGRGGFAAVWKAKDKKLGRMVAVKKLHPEHDGMAASRFKREAQSIAQLNHRNIVQVYDVGEQAGEIWLVMELIEGGSLRDLLKQKGKLSLDEALPLFKGIAQGLACAHRKNLVHRDIKPANILLAGSDINERSDLMVLTPKIVDFGLAQAGRDSELSMSGYGMGTPYYMPPEQRRDAKSVNHTADIYALGKVLYELVSGEIPDNVDPDLIPPPPELSQIIFKCIKSKPEDRYFSVDDLLRELEGMRPSVQPPPPKVSGGTTVDGNANTCPACGAGNRPDVKFCAGCGAGMQRKCPECEHENPVNIRFCAKCGTDMESFVAAQEVLRKVELYTAEKKWSRALKEIEGFKADTALPGTHGKELREKIGEYGNAVKATIRKIEELEKTIEQLVASAQEDEGRSLSADKQLEQDRELVKSFNALAPLKVISSEQSLLKENAAARIADFRRKALQAKFNTLKKVVGVVSVLLLMGGGGCLTYRNMLKDKYEKAVLEKNVEGVERLAAYAGTQRNPAVELGQLKEYHKSVEALAAIFEQSRTTLSRFGGGEWTGIQELLRRAADATDMGHALALIEQADGRIKRLLKDIAQVANKRDEFFKSWEKEQEGLKRYVPDGYAQLAAEIEKSERVTDRSKVSVEYNVLSGKLHTLVREREEVRKQEDAMTATAREWKAVWSLLQKGMEYQAFKLYAPDKLNALDQVNGKAEAEAQNLQFIEAEKIYKAALSQLEVEREFVQGRVREAACRLAQDSFDAALKQKQWTQAAEHARNVLKMGGADQEVSDRIRQRFEQELVPLIGLIEQYQELLAKLSKPLLEQYGGAPLESMRKAIEAADSAESATEAFKHYQQALSSLKTVNTQVEQVVAARNAWEESVEEMKIDSALIKIKHLERFAPEEWNTAQSLAQSAGNSDSVATAVLLYSQALESAAIARQKAGHVPGKMEIQCEVADFKVYDSKGRMLELRNGAVLLPPFSRYVLEVRARKHTSHAITVEVLEPGQVLPPAKVILKPWIGPEVGYPWEVTVGSQRKMRFVYIPSGRFTMGSENGESIEKPIRPVFVRNPVWMMDTEVTQEQYNEITGGNPSRNRGWSLPVEQVTWFDAMDFCQILTEREVNAGRLPFGFEYTLPTEAQWEYACRAGTTGDYAGNLDSMAWYDSNSGIKTHPVGTKQANAWGLHDMHGNVWEWCLDDFYTYAKAPLDERRRGNGSTAKRVNRGGGWTSMPGNCSSASRTGNPADQKSLQIGFRVVVKAIVYD